MTFEVLVLLFGVYVCVRGSIRLSFGLLAATTVGERWWPLAHIREGGAAVLRR
jgi:hypothetical protein